LGLFHGPLWHDNKGKWVNIYMNASNASTGTERLVSPSLEKARAPQSAVQQQKKIPLRGIVAAGLLCFAFGTGSGILIARQRASAHDIVVAVNGVTINKPEFYQRLEAAGGNGIIRSIVAEELEYQYAKKLGVAPTEAEVDAKINEAKQQPNFEAALAARGESLEDFKHRLRATLAKRAVLTKGVTASEEETRRFYAANIDKVNPHAQFYTPPTAVIAVIVTTTEAEGQRALDELNAGAPFQNVVSKYSKDISKSNGGVLSPILLGRTQANKVPGLEEAVFQLGVGQMIGPKQFAGTWWIIRCLDKKAEETQPYAKAAEDCHVGAQLSKVSPDTIKAIEAGYVKFQTESNVQAFWSQYRQAVTLK
jgi:parvulin-like peptidyl-prolyl isomerase